MVDISKEFDKFVGCGKNMRYTPGDNIHLILLDFRNPLKKLKYKQTDYMMYECNIIRRNGKDLNSQNFQVMFPIKNCWVKMYRELQRMNRLDDKNIVMTIDKINNYNFNIVVHR